jgi:hypothetical protein
VAATLSFSTVLNAEGIENNINVEEIQQQLNLNKEQVLQLKALLTIYQPGIQELMSQLRQADSIQKKRAIARSLKPLSEELDLKVKSILNEQQYDQWKTIQQKRQAEMRKKLR